MSSFYVRNLAAQWAAALATPYYNTVNEEQNPSDSYWLSLDFDAFSTVKETYCNSWEEQGAIHLLFFGVPGVAFQTLFQTAEADAATFFSNVDPGGSLTLEVMNAPLEFGGSDTPYFGVQVSIDYSYRHY